MSGDIYKQVAIDLRKENKRLQELLSERDQRILATEQCWKENGEYWQQRCRELESAIDISKNRVTQAQREIDLRETRCRELEKALEPFVEAIDKCDAVSPLRMLDRAELNGWPSSRWLNHGHLRAARAALKGEVGT